MRPIFPALLVVLLAAGCATAGAEADADPTASLAGAERTLRTESNGDVIEEYRVAGQLRIVKITPRNGVVHYLIDENADGRVDVTQGEGPVSPVYYKLFGW